MIKTPLIILSIFLSLTVTAQLTGRVQEADKVPIQGKDNMGDIVKIDGLHSYVFLKDCHQNKDSLGVWHTDFEFGNPNRIIAYNITIILQLNHVADSIIFTTDGIPKNQKITYAPDNHAASYSAAELSANATITATIFSKKKVFTTIVGVEGQIY